MRWALIAAVVLGLLAGVLPWLDCPHCDAATGRWTPVAGSWACPACFDRRRMSAVGRLGSPRVAPALLAMASRARLLGRERDALLAANGLDPEAEFRPKGAGFSKIYSAFYESEAGWRFLLTYSGSRGMFGRRRPMPFPARLYLFDEAGRLLDRWEIASAGPKLCADLDSGAAEGTTVVDIVPYLGDPTPADAAFDLLRDGKSERRTGASLRITLRGGRLAEAR